MTSSTLQVGQSFEALACRRLEQAGLTRLAANVRYRFGELDLIMREAGTVVFVEVRYRQNAHYGGGAVSVTPGKQRRLVRAASAWLAAHPAEAQRPCRFDVVSIDGNATSPDITWIKSAFTLDDLG